jgi:hypothetical protein
MGAVARTFVNSHPSSLSRRLFETWLVRRRLAGALTGGAGTWGRLGCGRLTGEALCLIWCMLEGRVPDVEAGMANGTPLSPAGRQLFAGVPGLGDMLAGQVSDRTEELRKRRLAQMAGRPLATDLSYGAGSLVGGPLNGFGRLR